MNAFASSAKRYFSADHGHGHHAAKAPLPELMFGKDVTFTPAERAQFERQLAVERAERKHFGPNHVHEHRVFNPPYSKSWTMFVMGAIIILGVGIPTSAIIFQQKKQGYWK